MLYYGFKNYEEFKEIFGYRQMSNGKKVRKTSKILLDFLKSRNVFTYCRETGSFEMLKTKSMAELDVVLKKKLNDAVLKAVEDFGSTETGKVMGFHFIVGKYRIDNKGLCMDYDCKSIRYELLKEGKIYKMKAGKFFCRMMHDNNLWKVLPQSTRTHLTESFVQSWEAFASLELDGYTLHIDKDFGKIYDSDECYGDFDSCMTDMGQHPFYIDSVDASAAYITKDIGGCERIMARCIIFNRVLDGECNIYRLAERQYSHNCNIVAKQILINKLIEAGAIDGYKKVGVDCHANDAFVSNDGEDWSHKYFRISCWLENGDVLSYQDSFIYYDPDKYVACNHPTAGCKATLDRTERYFESAYDEYHDCYCDDVVGMHYNGRMIDVDVERLDDFVEIDGEYYHHEEVGICDQCGKYYFTEDECYSEVTDDYYCSEDCCCEAEDEWYKNHEEYGVGCLETAC